MKQDEATRDEGYNRVTDTCIPEDVMLEIFDALLIKWADAGQKGESHFHWEYLYMLIKDNFFEGKNDVPMENSWVVAACDMGIPIYTPGVEDSTLGNMFCASVMQGKVANHGVIKSGTEQFEHFTNWYIENDKDQEIGFFQIGGGIAGDFSMCVVPSILQDHEKECKRWRYFCHIGDAVTSYGGYSGCPPNEKVTWHKLDPDTPNFTINSDASIVAPLVFQYVLEQDADNKAEAVSESDVILKKTAKKYTPEAVNQ
jgi:deoxyhypusine synthase